MEGKILLIDGNSILNRAFYGIPTLTSSEGLHTNAIYGFLNIMFRILDEEKAQYLAVAFDLKAPTFRHRLYEQYKGTRKPMPGELQEQVPVIREMMSAMKIPMMMLEGYEADDLIGTAAAQAEEAGLEVTILSGDRDLLQLASEKTCVRIPKTKMGKTEIEDYHASEVMERYGITPAQVIEIKALMGDQSDNIPGIPGVGEKTAQKILAEYGTLENAYAHADQILPARARNSLKEHYDLAVMSRTLATIDRHSPFTLDLSQAGTDHIYTQEAYTLCRKLGFRNMLSRFENRQTAQEEKVRLITSRTEADQFLQQALGELTGMEEKAVQEKTYLGISLPGGCMEDGFYAFYLPGTGCVCLHPERKESEVCENLSDWLKEAQGYDMLTVERAEEIAAAICKAAPAVAAVDLKEQLDHTGELESRQEYCFDAAIAAYLLNPLRSSYPFDEIAGEYCGRELPPKEELTGKKKEKELTSQQYQANQALCACREAWTASQAMPRLLDQLREKGMEELFLGMEMPLVFTLYRMQKAGIAVRAEELKSYGIMLEGRIRTLESRIYEEAGETFNINSPKQLGVILFEKMHMPMGKKTKTGYSTAADVLEKLSEDYPFVADILEYRQLTKLKSTYADGLSAYISADGRIHGTFNQTITATGRISSTEPNLQNIPVRTELGSQLRRVFVPKEGYLFVDADYSQIELRVLADASGDEKLISAYSHAQDIHAITASQVFHVPLEEVTSLQRRNAKAVNFGIVYGISSFGLSQGLSITRKEAQEYIERYFETYPGIRAFLDHCVAFAKEKGYAVTMFGRRRPVPELESSNFMQRSFGERVAMNSPIQGTAADIIKIAMIRVDRRLMQEKLSSRLVLQIHDELLVETEPSEEEKVKTILREEMTGAAALKVALEIDMHSGQSWYDAK